jgi:hypothetical protein
VTFGGGAVRFDLDVQISVPSAGPTQVRALILIDGGTYATGTINLAVASPFAPPCLIPLRGVFFLASGTVPAGMHSVQVEIPTGYGQSSSGCIANLAMTENP